MSTGEAVEPTEPRTFPTRSVQLEGLLEVVAELLDQALDASARWV